MDKKPAMQGVVLAVALHLARTREPMCLGDAREVVGAGRNSSWEFERRLRELVGAHLIETVRIVTPTTGYPGRYPVRYFQIADPPPFLVREEEPDRRTRPRPLTDLWRGWVNPETGIIPPRLGLDLKEQSQP